MFVVVLMYINLKFFITVYRVPGKFTFEQYNFTLENDIKVDLRGVGKGVHNSGVSVQGQMASTFEHVKIPPPTSQ